MVAIFDIYDGIFGNFQNFVFGGLGLSVARYYVRGYGTIA